MPPYKRMRYTPNENQSLCETYDYKRCEVYRADYVADIRHKLRNVHWNIRESPSSTVDRKGNELDLSEKIFQGTVFLIPYGLSEDQEWIVPVIGKTIGSI